MIRRTSTLAAGAAIALLSACAGGSQGVTNTSVVQPIPTASAGDAAGFNNFVAAFRPRAISAGISPATYDRAMSIARYNPEVIRLDRRQSEFTKQVWEYLDSAVSANRITTGRQMAGRYGSTLAAVEARYGVPREVVLAVWGMESNFGANRGSMQIIPSLATLAYDGRRGEMFQNQLIAALRIIQAGDVNPAGMVGSWAGAMGHTQFMPTSYLEYAVDFNGDGRRDIWSDDPTDSLASTAAYLRRSGWQPGQPWVVEVRLPSNFNYANASKSVRRSGAQWNQSGVRTASGGAVPNVNGSILAPAGARGPAFLITDNFRAILRYNNSDAYALGVSYLAEAIAGRSGVQGAWPRNDSPLSNAQKSEIQRLLTARGFDTGGVDGKLGSNSIEAIKAFQRSVGIAPDGYANEALLARLRR